jgi:hypothetical protein
VRHLGTLPQGSQETLSGAAPDGIFLKIIFLPFPAFLTHNKKAP